MCISEDQNNCLLELVFFVIPLCGLATLSITYLIKVEYLRNPMGPVAKHISTVSANPLVLVPSPTRRVTSSLHLICKRYQYQKRASVISSELQFITKNIINLLFNFSPIREPHIISSFIYTTDYY